MKRLIKASEVHSGEVRSRPIELPDVGSEARRIIEDHTREARRIVEAARRQGEAIQREAGARGYQEGLARGREEGLAQGRHAAQEQAGQKLSSDLAEVAALARKVVEEFSSARGELLQKARAEMLDFALEIARKIVGRAAESDVQAARENLQKVLELAAASGNVTVLVHPSQLQALQEHAIEVVEALRFRGSLKLAGDERIAKGGVKLLSRQGEIDATIETQFANVAEALRGRAEPGEKDDEIV